MNSVYEITNVLNVNTNQAVARAKDFDIPTSKLCYTNSSLALIFQFLFEVYSWLTERLSFGSWDAIEGLLTH